MHAPPLPHAPPPTHAAEMAVLRASARAELAHALALQAAAAWSPHVPAPPPRHAPAAAAAALEAAVWAAAPEAPRPDPKESRDPAARAAARQAARAAYARRHAQARAALARPAGPFPDDLLGLRLLAGRLAAPADLAAAAAALLAAAAAPAEPPEPRAVLCRLFARTLAEAAPEYAADRPRALAAARAIEASCYNAAVAASKASEEPSRRQWDSAGFVDLYSTRCGALVALLDPASSTCRAYGARLVPRLLSGELAPGALGAQSAAALLPEATAAERAELARRAAQRVPEKESVLFRCPHCGERRCSYRVVQLRSLDEAPDYLCRCLSPLCGRSFKGHT